MVHKEYWVEDYIRSKGYYCAYRNGTPEPGYIHVIEHSAYDTLKKQLDDTIRELGKTRDEAADRECKLLKHCEKLADAAKLGLSFAPKERPVDGLCPTFYHTLNFADECKLQDRIDSAREALANFETFKKEQGE